MSDDSLRAIWTLDPPPLSPLLSHDALITATNAVLDEDRAARDKDRRVHILGGCALALLCPALLWCAAYGVNPLVRGGYALMAAGTAILVSTGWLYSAWSRQALPGPVDSRSQLQKSAFLLSRQADLMRKVRLYCAPIFIGTALIATWIYQQRSAEEAYGLWALIAVAWLVVSVRGMSSATKLEERKVRLERLLADLM
jgi:hypothetical protein